jgi:hypothetical protein
MTVREEITERIENAGKLHQLVRNVSRNGKCLKMGNYLLIYILMYGGARHGHGPREVLVD